MDRFFGVDINKCVILLNIVGGQIVGEEPYKPSGRKVIVGDDNFLYEIEEPDNGRERQAFIVMHGKPYIKEDRLCRNGNPILFHPNLREFAEVKEFAPGYFVKVRDFLGN